MRAMRTALLAAACSTVFSSLPAFAAQLLAPHRAVYDLALDKATDRSGITDITGRMVYEFNGSVCEGYTVTFRFVTRINSGDTTQLTDQQTTTFEDAEGKTFSFVTKTFVDQNLNKETRGTATRDGKGVKVEIEKPERRVSTSRRHSFRRNIWSISWTRPISATRFMRRASTTGPRMPTAP